MVLAFSFSFSFNFSSPLAVLLARLRQPRLSRFLTFAGYRVIIPDLYRGKLGVDAEEAHHLMTNLDFVAAVDDIRGAAKLLKSEGTAKVRHFCMFHVHALSKSTIRYG